MGAEEVTLLRSALCLFTGPSASSTAEVASGSLPAFTPSPVRDCISGCVLEVEAVGLPDFPTWHDHTDAI